MLRQATSRLATVASRRPISLAPSYRHVGAGGVRSFSSAAPEATDGAEHEPVTPDEVFDAIDENKDGVLQRDEFLRAVEMLHYSDLLKIKTSLARNELSYESEHKDAEEADSFASMMARRIQVTAEVTVSKIFPAGFGWQTSATMAEAAGMSDANLDFALATGFGDGLGVFLGHTLYCVAKKAVVDPTIDIKSQSQTGILLGSAAFCSGSAWQPFVNAIQAAGFGFTSSLILTGMCGTAAFFGGLRAGRAVYGKIFDGVDEATYANLKADAALSVAVGGAAGCFVGTDVSYGAANWLRPIVGVEETTASMTASVLAGSSTSLGFCVVQMGENALYPKNKCWVD